MSRIVIRGEAEQTDRRGVVVRGEAELGVNVEETDRGLYVQEAGL